MPNFLVQDIVDRACAIADMRGNFVKPEQWLAWYNNGAKALDLLILRSGWVQNTLSSQDNDVDYTISLTNPDSESGPPHAVLGVYEVRDGRFRPLKFRSPAEFALQDLDNPSVTGTANYYTITSGNWDDDLTIHMFPQPTSGTYRALFWSMHPTADALDDEVTWPLGFEEYIVLFMARRALIKENSETRQVDDELGAESQRIEEICWDRNAAQAPTIRNVDKAERGWGWQENMAYGPWESWYWL